MHLPYLCRFVLVAAALAAFCDAQDRAPLNVGGDAPQLKVDRWLKGAEVSKFERGHVYVVEFWATWCGPCRQAMPHLSELAKRHAGQATFIGVNIWEGSHSKPGVTHETIDAQIDAFMKSDGDRLMQYTVCVGAQDDSTAKNWMNATGQAGIPATFIVDKSGKVAWIGHPIYSDEPLAKIIDGTFDVAAFGVEKNLQINKAYQDQSVDNELRKPIKAALDAKNYELALSEFDKALAKVPDSQKLALAFNKFEMIAEHLPAKAYAEALRAASEKDQRLPIALAYSMTENKLNSKDYLIALKCLKEEFGDPPTSYKSVYNELNTRLGGTEKAETLYKDYLEELKRTRADKD